MRHPAERRRRRRPLFAVVVLVLAALLAPDLTIAPAGGDPVEPAAAAIPVDPVAVPAWRMSWRLGPRPLDHPIGPLAAEAGGVGPADPALARRYQAALDAALEASGAPALTFSVVRDGVPLWQGSAAHEGARGPGDEPWSVETPLVIGSVTKTFVAAAVLQLTEEGAVDLDDPVGAYLPALSIDRAITVRQLLDHSSGLADVFNDATRTGIEEHPERAWDPDRLLATLHEPWYPPGQGWAYANTNYLILALLLEELSGLPLEEELARRFLEPLSLAATRLIAPSGTGEPLAPAWATIFRGSGAMVSTAPELAHWGDAIYAGDVLAVETRGAMLDFNGHDHGLGVQRLEVAGARGYGHTGMLDRYTALLLHLPREGVTMALLVNRSRVDLGAIVGARAEDGPSLIELVTDR